LSAKRGSASSSGLPSTSAQSRPHSRSFWTAISTLVGRLLNALGQYAAIDEQYFDALTAVGGSGPAFLFEFVAGLRDAGLAAGLPDDVAYRAALETTLGAARLLSRSSQTPETMREKVTSPNGTTHAGLQVLAARQFRDTLKETIAAATRRAAELSKD
jgi:pyrroline-5-carboxylate reductase